ncbi:MAG: hypothetical protein ACKOPO_08165 [Novosphingobium sp.]
MLDVSRVFPDIFVFAYNPDSSCTDDPATSVLNAKFHANAADAMAARPGNFGAAKLIEFLSHRPFGEGCIT